MKEGGRVGLLWLTSCHWGLSVAQCAANQPWGLLAGEEVLGTSARGSSHLPEPRGQCKHHLPLQLYDLSPKSTIGTTKHLPQD